MSQNIELQKQIDGNDGNNNKIGAIAVAASTIENTNQLYETNSSKLPLTKLTSVSSMSGGASAGDRTPVALPGNITLMHTPISVSANNSGSASDVDVDFTTHGLYGKNNNGKSSNGMGNRKSSNIRVNVAAVTDGGNSGEFGGRGTAGGDIDDNASTSSDELYNGDNNDNGNDDDGRSVVINNNGATAAAAAGRNNGRGNIGGMATGGGYGNQLNSEDDDASGYLTQEGEGVPDENQYNNNNNNNNNKQGGDNNAMKGGAMQGARATSGTNQHFVE